jgi:hypothetical protein
MLPVVVRGIAQLSAASSSALAVGALRLCQAHSKTFCTTRPQVLVSRHRCLCSLRTGTTVPSESSNPLSTSSLALQARTFAASAMPAYAQ